MNGGPAFPQCVATDHDGQRVCSFDFVDGAGMDLRDFFAAHALIALMSSDRWVDGLDRATGDGGFKTSLSHHAYQLADAMLEARKS